MRCYSDCFCFRVSAPTNETTRVKRKLLSQIAGLYDPLGWLAPVIVTAKILMQSLWALKLGWDQELPMPIVSAWFECLNGLPLLNSFSITRWTGFFENWSLFEIHGFADSSKHAYADILYAKVIVGDKVVVSL